MNATATKRPPIRVSIRCTCGWAKTAEGAAPTDDAAWDAMLKRMRATIDELGRQHLASESCALGVLRGGR